MKSVMLGDGTRLDLSDEEYAALTPLINKYNEAYGYGYKFNIPSPKWQDFIDGYADDVVASYARGVEFVRPVTTATTTPSTTTTTTTSPAATTPPANDTPVVTQTTPEPSVNIPPSVVPQPEEQTNWLAWICGGLAAVILLPALFVGNKKKKRR